MVLFTAPVVHATEAFELAVKQTTVQLGKPVWLDISTNKRSPTLDSLDFAPLEAQFEVVKDKNEIRPSDKGQQWRIRLYPRRQGSLTIRSLSFQSHTSSTIHIQAEAPIDGKTGKPFSVKYSVGNTKLWLRQQVVVRYDLITPKTSLVLAPQQATPANLLLIPLTTIMQQRFDNNRYSTGWAIYPRQAGKHVLHLPALDYIQDGVVTHRFYPPALTLNVKPLPAYLPGNLPVGRLSLQLTEMPGLVLKNNLTDIQLQFTGAGIPSQWLPDIRQLFQIQ